MLAALAALVASSLERQHMPGADPTSWGPNLKETYDTAFRNQLSEDHIVESFMRSDTKSEKWEGKERVIPNKIGRNHSSASIGVGGRLPQAGRQQWKEYRVGARDTYTRVGFERYVMEQTKNKKGAFAEVVATEMELAYEDLLFHRNRVMWGTGSGVLALVNGAHVATTTLELKAPGNITGTILANRYLHGTTDGGMFIAIVTSGGVIEGTAFVEGANADGTDVTLGTAVTCSDNSRVVVATAPDRHSLDKEPEGLLAGIDDSTFVATYHDMSRTTYPSIKSTVITGVGSFSFDAIQQGIDAQMIRTGKTIDFFLCEFAVRRAYLQLLEQDRRYTGADLMSPDGGTKVVKNPAKKIGANRKAITFGDLPMFEDRDAPFAMLFGVNKESWTRFVLAEGEWDDTDGKVMKWVQEFDQWTAFYRMMDNFHCQYPNRNIRWEGIDVDQILVRAA